MSKFREESEFSTWLYSVAYNTAISELRKRKNIRLTFEDNYYNTSIDDISDKIDDVNIEQQLIFLDTVLEKMPTEDTLLITMFYLNEHSIKDISEIVGQSTANIKVRLHRIRKYMNGEINKLIQQ